MEHQLLNEVVKETAERLKGRFLGKIFQLSKFSFALDFGLRGTSLLISPDPTSPRYYLIERRQKELEKQSDPLSQFGQLLRSKLGGAKVNQINKHESDRIIHVGFSTQDEIAGDSSLSLVVQLTGRASNLFLLDDSQIILAGLRPVSEPGQRTGDRYQPPTSSRSSLLAKEVSTSIEGSASAHADAVYRTIDERNEFEIRAKRLQSKVRRELSKQKKLKTNLELDLRRHGNPESYKQLGDLLLANVGTAIRNQQKVQLIDYYSDDTPTIEIEVDPGSSLQDEAARNFRLYTKAKRAREATKERLKVIEDKIQELGKRAVEIEGLIKSRNIEGLSRFEEPGQKPTRHAVKQKIGRIPGVKRYLSSDGYEVWVGRAARDNDNLTFKLARPHDLWMHTADYPGSHVIVRNSTRKEIPHRTIIEAAQLAARFSKASEDTKVVVHYAERKFLSKPKGAAPGLVRMSKHRSITVEPKEGLERIQSNT